MIDAFKSFDLPEVHLFSGDTDHQQTFGIYFDVSDSFLVLSDIFSAFPVVGIPEANISIIQSNSCEVFVDLSDAVDNPLAFFGLAFFSSIQEMDGSQLLIISTSNQLSLRVCQSPDRVLNNFSFTSEICLEVLR